MRRRIGTCLLTVLMLAALTIPAFAADGPKIDNTDESKCVTTIAPAEKGKLSVKVQKPQSGAQYLIYILDNQTGVPKESTIKYIDQNGTGVFLPFPKDQSGTYYIFVTSSTDTRFDSKNYVATVEYKSSTVEYKLGDVDNNGKVEPDDALEALKIYVGKNATPTEQQLLSANVYEIEKNKVDPNDALAILQFYVGKISDFN